MEKFKAVEKAMKTKAYSKEGLSAAAKLDPKEQAKMEASEFLSNMVDELEQQIEILEAEGESLQATMRKGKGHAAKAERIAEIEHIIERHKWHQGKLELIRRSLENGGVDAEQVNELEESIKYYVSDGMNDDFMEDEGMYDDLNLQEEEDAYGMNQDNDRVSSQDTQSIQDDAAADGETRAAGALSGKPRSVVDMVAGSAARRPSGQLKSPLPTLATVHSTPLPTLSNGASGGVAMKPATVPARPAGEGMKYASAAAAAAANDKNNVGIAPLPPPPSTTPSASGASLSAAQAKAGSTGSPRVSSTQPASQEKASAPAAAAATGGSAASSQSSKAKGKAAAQPAASDTAESSRGLDKAIPLGPVVLLTWRHAAAQQNGAANGIRPIEEEEEEESIYHLPASLQDLVESYEITKKRPAPPNAPATQRMQASSEASKPGALDAEPPRNYLPDVRFYSHTRYPQEPLSIFDDPRLYTRIDPDTLFYVFYYKQGTYQQYLAAKALKDQSWRFHKQYQTWFQRHEEPKSITEEFEQGTYRFFDYESTWWV